MILDRFDAIFFVGDDSLKHIYAAINMLLRENIDMGGLKQWELSDSQRDGCRCDSQIAKGDCSTHIVTSSEEGASHDEGSQHKSPFYCRSTSLEHLQLVQGY